MRRLICYAALGLAVLTSGCARTPSTMAGGKPVDYWVKALHDPDGKMRKRAASKLGNVGTADPAAIPALIEATKDRDPAVRAEAVRALLRIGPAACEAVSALTEAAQQDNDARVRTYAARALEKIQNGG